MTEVLSAIKNLASKFKIGTGLDAIPIPTFFLEPSTMIELYTDLCRHPELFGQLDSSDDPFKRMLAVTQWFISGLEPRNSSKKPLNPLLGETFKCSLVMQGSPACASSSPSSEEPSPPFGKTIYRAESVETKPATGAYYIHNTDRDILNYGSVAAKAKFMGTSISLKNEGSGTIVMGRRDAETYRFNFPSVNVRGLLTASFRIEYVGRVDIICQKTRLQVSLDFKSKPMLFGSWDLLDGQIFSMDNPSAILATIKGSWADKLYFNLTSSPRDQLLWDAPRTPKTTTIQLAAEADREPTDSYVVWKRVKEALSRKDYDTADKEKKIVMAYQQSEQWAGLIGLPPSAVAELAESFAAASVSSEGSEVVEAAAASSEAVEPEASIDEDYSSSSASLARGSSSSSLTPGANPSHNAKYFYYSPKSGWVPRGLPLSDRAELEA